MALSNKQKLARVGIAVLVLVVVGGIATGIVFATQASPPVPISQLALTAYTDTALTLTWVNNDPEAVQTYTVNDGPVQTMTSGLTSATISGLLGGSQNTIRFFAAVGDVIDSSQSIKVLTKPTDNIQTFTTELTSNSVKFNWATDHTGYTTRKYSLNDVVRVIEPVNGDEEGANFVKFSSLVQDRYNVKMISSNNDPLPQGFVGGGSVTDVLVAILLPAAATFGANQVLTPRSATLTWTNDAQSTKQSLSLLQGGVLQQTLQSNSSQPVASIVLNDTTLTNPLTPGTEYQLQVVSASRGGDVTNNLLSTSSLYTFTTPLAEPQATLTNSAGNVALRLGADTNDPTTTTYMYEFSGEGIATTSGTITQLQSIVMSATKNLPTGVQYKAMVTATKSGSAKKPLPVVGNWTLVVPLATPIADWVLADARIYLHLRTDTNIAGTVYQYTLNGTSGSITTGSSASVPAVVGTTYTGTVTATNGAMNAVTLNVPTFNIPLAAPLAPVVSMESKTGAIQIDLSTDTNGPDTRYTYTLDGSAQSAPPLSKGLVTVRSSSSGNTEYKGTVSALLAGLSSSPTGFSIKTPKVEVPKAKLEFKGGMIQLQIDNTDDPNPLVAEYFYTFNSIKTKILKGTSNVVLVEKPPGDKDYSAIITAEWGTDTDTANLPVSTPPVKVPKAKLVFVGGKIQLQIDNTDDSNPPVVEYFYKFNGAVDETKIVRGTSNVVLLDKPSGDTEYSVIIIAKWGTSTDQTLSVYTPPVEVPEVLLTYTDGQIFLQVPITSDPNAALTQYSYKLNAGQSTSFTKGAIVPVVTNPSGGKRYTVQVTATWGTSIGPSQDSVDIPGVVAPNAILTYTGGKIYLQVQTDTNPPVTTYSYTLNNGTDAKEIKKGAKVLVLDNPSGGATYTAEVTATWGGSEDSKQVKYEVPGVQEPNAEVSYEDGKIYIEVKNNSDTNPPVTTYAYTFGDIPSTPIIKGTGKKFVRDAPSGGKSYPFAVTATWGASTKTQTQSYKTPDVQTPKAVLTYKDGKIYLWIENTSDTNPSVTTYSYKFNNGDVKPINKGDEVAVMNNPLGETTYGAKVTAKWGESEATQDVTPVKTPKAQEPNATMSLRDGKIYLKVESDPNPAVTEYSYSLDKGLTSFSIKKAETAILESPFGGMTYTAMVTATWGLSTAVKEVSYTVPLTVPGVVLFSSEGSIYVQLNNTDSNRPDTMYGYFVNNNTGVQNYTVGGEDNVVASAKPGTTYSVKATATVDDKMSVTSAVVVYTTSPVAPIAEEIYAIGNNLYMTLQAGENGAATSYSYTDGIAASRTVAVGVITIVTGFKPGTTYRAVATAKANDVSVAAAAREYTTRPFAPDVGELSVSLVNSGNLSMTIGANENGDATTYSYRANDDLGDTPTSLGPVDVVTSYTPGTTYSVIAKATANGESKAAEARVFTTIPNAPKVGELTVSDGNLYMTFEANGNGPAAKYSYKVNNRPTVTSVSTGNVQVVTGYDFGTTYSVVATATSGGESRSAAPRVLTTVASVSVVLSFSGENFAYQLSGQAEANTSYSYDVYDSDEKTVVYSGSSVEFLPTTIIANSEYKSGKSYYMKVTATSTNNTVSVSKSAVITAVSKPVVTLSVSGDKLAYQLTGSNEANTEYKYDVFNDEKKSLYTNSATFSVNPITISEFKYEPWTQYYMTVTATSTTNGSSSVSDISDIGVSKRTQIMRYVAENVPGWFDVSVSLVKYGKAVRFTQKAFSVNNATTAYQYQITTEQPLWSSLDSNDGSFISRDTTITFNGQVNDVGTVAFRFWLRDDEYIHKNMRITPILRNGAFKPQTIHHFPQITLDYESDNANPL